ncbi:MAG: NADP(H)-dependent aldo-keto reductase [Gammaproteobacteria bacterium]|jgi:aryl-alcohol dehydrogenase-like predicted oxidoreductase|nr:NADP(H)-dependent aldo-keto reductase [Gammaproteobacteria bacterium]
MKYSPLGTTGIEVSRICLGTMTFGEQNTEAEAHAQLDAALDAGINFIDTAEMYPVPPRAETYGRTERYIGSWLSRRGQRDRLVLATKVMGPSEDLHYVRDGSTRLDHRNIEAAIDASLQRLGTDYIDLYQLHWPDRRSNFFGKLGYQHDAQDDPVPLEETLEVLGRLVKAGKVRHIGVSNETPWGVMRLLQLAAERGLPRIVSIQNPYNLLNRSFEIGLAEIAHRESVGLLAYSPLGFGVLSGKYLDGKRPEGARLTRFQRFQRYTRDTAQAPVRAYVETAGRHGLDPAQMALAYVNSRPFLTSTIIGATDLQQLAANIASNDLELSEEVLAEIEAIHLRHPNPCP